MTSDKVVFTKVCRGCLISHSLSFLARSHYKLENFCTYCTEFLSAMLLECVMLRIPRKEPVQCISIGGGINTHCSVRKKKEQQRVGITAAVDNSVLSVNSSFCLQMGAKETGSLQFVGTPSGVSAGYSLAVTSYRGLGIKCGLL